MPGFTERWHQSDQSSIQVDGPDGKKWWFSSRDFNEWRKDIEQISDWVYSGGNELVLVNVGVGKHYDEPFIDFDRALEIKLDKLKESDSIAELFERIFRYSESPDLENPIDGFSTSEGKRLGKNAAKDILLSLLPESLRRHFDEGFGYAIRSLSARDDRRVFLRRHFGDEVL